MEGVRGRWTKVAKGIESRSENQRYNGSGSGDGAPRGSGAL